MKATEVDRTILGLIMDREPIKKHDGTIDTYRKALIRQAEDYPFDETEVLAIAKRLHEVIMERSHEIVRHVQANLPACGGTGEETDNA